MVAGGLDARILGLFEGPTDREANGEDPPPAPSRIALFWFNLLASFGDDEELLCEEVKITLLHEIGHYFGLNEQEVAALGLE